MQGNVNIENSFDYYHIMKGLTLIKYVDAHITTYFNHRILVLCFFKGSLSQNIWELD